MEFKHISVLFGESIDALNIKPNGIYADGTLGGGGHSHGILSTNDSCRLIGIDQDKEAIAAAKERLKEFDGRVTFVNRNFSEIKDILSELDIDEIDGAVLDLGVSSYQLDNAERGFSYMHDAALDMRMNTSSPKSAYDVVNSYSCEELMRIFYDYGEEKWSKRIAEFICEKRKTKPVETTFELVEIIKAAIPKKVRMEGGHPAKDRIVKTAFAELARGCTCPKEFPVCVCGKKPEIKIISRKPILPSEEELEHNSRSKSAKLRIAEKL